MTRDEVQAVIETLSNRSIRAVYASESNAYGDAARMLIEALEKSEEAANAVKFCCLLCGARGPTEDVTHASKCSGSPPRPERRALVQGDCHRSRGTVGREPGTVAWSEHEEAWRQYDRDGHGSQSAERINERGGFGYTEISTLLRHAPRTWKAGQ